MKYIKLFENYSNTGSYQLKDDISFEVTNGGASTGTEYGYVEISFEIADETYDIRFDVYQVAGGSETIDFIEIEDLETAKELGIPITGEDRLDENDELYGIVFDAYASGHDAGTSSEGDKGDYNDMEYTINSVSAEGVIEEGWLDIILTNGKDSIEISFDIRQDSNGNWNATFNSDEDGAKCKEFGVELDEDFEAEILRAYGDV